MFLENFASTIYTGLLRCWYPLTVNSRAYCDTKKYFTPIKSLLTRISCFPNKGRHNFFFLSFSERGGGLARSEKLRIFVFFMLPLTWWVSKFSIWGTYNHVKVHCEQERAKKNKSISFTSPAVPLAEEERSGSAWADLLPSCCCFVSAHLPTSCLSAHHRVTTQCHPLHTCSVLAHPST